MNIICLKAARERRNALEERCLAHYRKEGDRAAKLEQVPYTKEQSHYMEAYQQAYLAGMWRYHMIAAMSSVVAYRLLCVKRHTSGTDDFPPAAS